jgi:CheY-like chemotaxis protein
LSEVGGNSPLIPPRSCSNSLSDVAVLVIEHQCHWVLMLRDMLEGLGAAVVPAKSADDAQVLLKAFRPDLVFCDLISSQREGLAFVAWLRRRPERALRDTPTVGLTTSFDANDLHFIAGQQSFRHRARSPEERLQSRLLVLRRRLRR